MTKKDEIWSDVVMEWQKEKLLFVILETASNWDEMRQSNTSVIIDSNQTDSLLTWIWDKNVYLYK